MMQREGKRVKIDISDMEFLDLLLCMGTATGFAHREGDTARARRYLKLANAVNLGNPDWVPYKIEEEKETVTQ
jgi:hypothetical protein